MSTEKKYTERDLVLAKREGWMRHCKDECWSIPEEVRSADAARAFPLPKVTRLKEVKDADGDLWSVRDGVLGLRADYTGSTWCAAEYFNSPAMLGALRDLLNNPTEEVEDA